KQTARQRVFCSYNKRDLFRQGDFVSSINHALLFSSFVLHFDLDSNLGSRLCGFGELLQNEMVSADKAAELGHILLWFAPGRNIRKLILTKSTDDDLACIHGLRFFSIVWVVV